MRGRMAGLIESGLQHAQLWKGEQLVALLEDPDKKRETSEYTRVKDKQLFLKSYL